MTNSEAQAAMLFTSPNCAGYLRKWNLATKTSCCTWSKRSQEASPNRSTRFSQETATRAALSVQEQQKAPPHDKRFVCPSLETSLDSGFDTGYFCVDTHRTSLHPYPSVLVVLYFATHYNF